MPYNVILRHDFKELSKDVQFRVFEVPEPEGQTKEFVKRRLIQQQ